MPAKVFISCGQADDEEKKTAVAVKDWLEENGFKAFVATTEQDVYDINSGIIEVLRAADYFLLIDFKREMIGPASAAPVFRGSLFCHQELALAKLLGFRKAIFLVEIGVLRVGMFGFLAGNAKTFHNHSEIIPLIQELVESQGWTTSHSRHLRVDNAVFSGPLQFKDHAGHYKGKALKAEIHNHRNDIAAKNCSARLKSYTDDGKLFSTRDRSSLKVDGAIGFSQFIWPQSHGAFDLLWIDALSPYSFCLLSALDVPREYITVAPGPHEFTYEVYADDFQIYEFTLSILLTGNLDLPAPLFVKR